MERSGESPTVLVRVAGATGTRWRESATDLEKVPPRGCRRSGHQHACPFRVQVEAGSLQDGTGSGRGATEQSGRHGTRPGDPRPQPRADARDQPSPCGRQGPPCTGPSGPRPRRTPGQLSAARVGPPHPKLGRGAETRKCGSMGATFLRRRGTGTGASTHGRGGGGGAHPQSPRGLPPESHEALGGVDARK